MTSRGGRERLRRDPLPRSEERRSHVPPSRHLWVGNLSLTVTERILGELFLRFGELESVAFQPSRSYAFINFVKDEDAINAIRALQGFVVAGNPLKIEFAKADKSSTPSRDEDYFQHRDEHRPSARGSPFPPQRDSRTRHGSPDQFYPEKSRMSDRAEPSEILWIGFPALLKVDEVILRKAFQPFGEIVKITVFPGRSYAFVQFRNIASAGRAKDTLQGKLFGNPRVHICFAKGDMGRDPGPPNYGRSHGNVPPSPHFRPEGYVGPDRDLGSFNPDPSIRPPHFMPNIETGFPDAANFGRKGSSWMGGNDAFEQRAMHNTEREDMYDHRNSPHRNSSGVFRDFSPQKHPRKGSVYEEPWDPREEAFPFHGAKKLKTGSFPPEKELPEYPFSEPEEKRVIPTRFSNFPQPKGFDKNFESGPFEFKQNIPDHPMNMGRMGGERNDQMKARYDDFQMGSSSAPLDPIEWNRFTPEPPESPVNEVWKWEGILAKGGTTVCRARCFPVGKVLDIMLPGIIDCTARTGLDMLSKHYYQAVAAWVVFFVPQSDADIGYYNEFMNYLGEKERAAVCKLDDKTTLFLVPPSDFSEKVLKVPGKLSISGVVLKLEHPSSNPVPPPHHLQEKKERNFTAFRSDPPYQRPVSPPSGPFPSSHSFSNMAKPGPNNLNLLGNMQMSGPDSSFSIPSHVSGPMPESFNENRHEFPHHQRNFTSEPNWSPHHPQNPNSGPRNAPPQPPNFAAEPPHHQPRPRAMQEPNMGHYASGISGNPSPGGAHLSVSSSTPNTGLPPDQLAQLASSLLGQQRQTMVPMGEDIKQLNAMNQPENPFRAPQRYGMQQNQQQLEVSSSQFSQVQHLQPLPPPPPPPPMLQLQQQQQQREVHTGNQSAQNASASTQEEEADPQKRLQATLQLAAALLQQIQQGK